MNKIFALLLGSSLPLLATAQATLYNNGATIHISNGGTLYVRGDMVNAATATIDNNGTLRATGNATNNGVINATGTLLLEGTTAQTLSGSSPVATGAVVVNNAAGVTLATPLRIAGAATFTNGIINAPAAASPVIFTATGSVSGTPTNASHVNGYVRKLGTGDFTYPVGDATNYQPVGANLSANPTGMTARYMAGDAGSAPYGTTGAQTTPLLFYNAAEYWDLTPVSTATGTVTIYYDGYNNPGNVNTPADLRVAHKTGGQWLNEGGTASDGSITSNSISTFSPFTLGSISLSTPLPIVLLSFAGRADGDANLVSWETGLEDAGTTFTVERSANASGFDALGTTGGRGSNSRYAFRDERPRSPISYYRLKSTDAAGGFTYSSIAMVQRTAGGAGVVVASPVPATRAVIITNTDASLNGMAAVVCDAQGKTVHAFRMKASQTIDLGAWTAGIYYLRAGAAVIRIEKR